MSLVTQGFHHITLVCSDAPRTLRFYREILGLRLVKRTVQFDAPSSHDLYFANQDGSPGTIVAFLEWPSVGRGRWGVGGIHHLALGVGTPEAQLKWKRWLTDKGVAVSGPYNRGYFKSIYFKDPDGQVLEIATEGPGFAIDEPIEALGQKLMVPPARQLQGSRDEVEIQQLTHPERLEQITRDMALQGIHHITGITDDVQRAHEFYGKALGLRLIKQSVNQDDPNTPHYFWGSYDGKTIQPHSDLTLFGWPTSNRTAAVGVGQTHHVAFRTSSAEEQLEWRDHLLSMGLNVSDVMDRKYFSSIYFRAPDGLLLEIATDQPGFAVDEEPDRLGESLQLPAALEGQRAEIAARLKPLR